MVTAINRYKWEKYKTEHIKCSAHKQICMFRILTYMKTTNRIKQIANEIFFWSLLVEINQNNICK